MTVPGLENLLVDHIEFYVRDVEPVTRWFVDRFGFAVYAATPPVTDCAKVRSVALGHHQIRIVLTSPLVEDHPATAYVERHGDGVAVIGLRVPDATLAFTEAVRRGARPVTPPSTDAGVVTASIMAFGDVAHTFIQRPADLDPRMVPGLRPVADGGFSPADADADRGPGTGLLSVDHFAVCVEPGSIDDVVAFYQTSLGFDLTLVEHIVVGNQAMMIKVVRSGDDGLTLTLIEPDSSRVAGHVDEYLKSHGGPGVQHVAFGSDAILRSVEALAQRGVQFLDTPAEYYHQLPGRLTPAAYSVADLRRLNVLVDEEPDGGQLYQIFTRSVHPRNTIFYEVIERLGARTFGSGNISALYQAVERQRQASLLDGAQP